MAQAEKEVLFSRVFHASRERVWKAWTDAEELKKWWGPQGVTIPECDVDLRVGGRLYIVMLAGDMLGPFKGLRWPIEATFTEVTPVKRLVFKAKGWTEGQEAETQIDQISELTLSDDGGKTKMDLKVTLLKTGPGAKMAAQGMEMGFNQQFDKLETYLAQ